MYLTALSSLARVSPCLAPIGSFAAPAHLKLYLLSNCEAQGKGRARGGPRKVTERSFMDGGWWLVVYLSLMLYTKFG